MMAKPFELELSSTPGPSKASFFPLHLSGKAREPILHRSHRPSPRPLSKTSPSTTLLSLLASIASASSVYGSPAPPPFLCPTLESGEIADCTIVQRAPTQIRRSPPRAIDIKNQITPRNVPDRYSQEADGAWRRVGSYTLYGSTMPACSSSSCATPTTPAISPLDDQLQVGDSADPSMTSQTSDDKPTDLPPGWKPLDKHNRTAVILVISLILALFIGSFIIGCMFCRNRMKKTRHKFLDVEAKAKRRRRMSNDADIREIAVEKEVKAKQKIWAKATARWRTNARLAARQRRGRRTGTRLSQSNHSSASLEGSRSCFVESSTLPHSESSPESSTVSLGGDIRRSDIPVSSSRLSQDNTPIPNVPAEPPVRTSPPAYHHHHGQIPSLVISTGEETRIEFAGPSTAAGWERLPQVSCASPYTSVPDLVSSCPTSASLHAAHVATDDKILLSRLAELASAPPDDTSEEVLQTSAPEWQDEDLEDIAHLLTATFEPFPFSTMFPAPPSKERLAAAEFYDHSYSFEEVDPAELASCPSAPPFEEGPSPPQRGLVPSAPPLFDDDQTSQEAQPSAPIWERSTQNEQEPETDDTNGQGQEPSDVRDISSGGRRSFSGTSASPVRDSILLPGYQP